MEKRAIVAPHTGRPARRPLPSEISPMEARTADVLPPQDGGWVYEPKWNGFRCLAFKEADGVELLGKSGKPLGRYFPEIVALLRALPVERFGVDGELVVDVDGRLSFDALQMRLHPAESRIRKLSAETPARLILFDMLVTPDGTSMLKEPLTRRRQALESFVKVAGVRASSPYRRPPAISNRRSAGSRSPGMEQPMAWWPSGSTASTSPANGGSSR